MIQYYFGGIRFMDGYFTAKEISNKWGISTRRIGTLCTQGRIPGATKMGPIWVIPKDATKPLDNRRKDKGESAK